MGVFDFLKSDETKREEQREKDLLWAKSTQAKALHDGGEGVRDGDLMRLMSAAHVAANAIKGKKDPDEIQAIIASAWSQNVQQIEPPPGVAEAIYHRIVAPAVNARARNEVTNNIFEGLYDHDEPAPDHAAPHAPVTPAAPRPHAAPIATVPAPRPKRRPNMEHDAEGSVDEEDLAYIREQQAASKHRRRHH